MDLIAAGGGMGTVFDDDGGRSELRTLVAPGLHDSGPRHWQSLWLAEHPEYERVTQRNWDEPVLAQWSAAVLGKLGEREASAIVVAHSFGCLAAVHAAGRASGRIRGGLLVAPPDPARLRAGAALASVRLGPAWILVGSRNDPWMAFDRARAWAAAWSCRFVDAGHAGHLNVASGHGPWSLGERLLVRVHAQAAASRSREAGIA
jgi:predicted alpha/beta hydrolase family esterase